MKSCWRSFRIPRNPVDREDKIYRWGGGRSSALCPHLPIARALMVAGGDPSGVISEYQTLSVTGAPARLNTMTGEAIDQLFPASIKAVAKMVRATGSAPAV